MVITTVGVIVTMARGKGGGNRLKLESQYTVKKGERDEKYINGCGKGN